MSHIDPVRSESALDLQLHELRRTITPITSITSGASDTGFVRCNNVLRATVLFSYYKLTDNVTSHQGSINHVLVHSRYLLLYIT